MVRHCVREHGIAAIEPGGMLEVLRPCFGEFRPLLPVAPDARLVYANLTKFDVFHRLLDGFGDPRVSENLLETLLLERTQAVDLSLLQKLPHPVFLKTDNIYSHRGKAGAVVSAGSPPSFLYGITGPG